MINSYARFIGGVGALAVALGVGGAIGTSPGIALADDPTPSSSDSTASGSNSTAPSAADQSTTSPTSGAHLPSPKDEPVVHISGGVTVDGKKADSDTTDTKGTPKSDEATGSAGSPSVEDESSSSTDGAPATDDTPPMDEDAADSTGAAESDQGSGSDEGEHRTSHRLRDKSVEDGWNARKATPGAAEDSADPNEAGQVRPLDTAAASDLDTPASTSLQDVKPQTLASTFAAAVTEQPVVQQQARTMTLPGAIISAASNLINAALTAIVGQDPTAPSDSPLLWGLLGWVRRQFSAQFADDTPVTDVAQTTLAAAAADDTHAGATVRT
jgi:hypothetical protein